MGNFADKNAQAVLEVVEKNIKVLEDKLARDREFYRGWRPRRTLRIWDVCDELSIFDWWNEGLSLSQLKQMRTFLKEAIKLGFTGYVCFKVGASGCANGMWAHIEESKDGYSPNCDFLYRSFTPDYTYWDITYGHNSYKSPTLSRLVDKKYDALTTIRDLENALKEYEDNYFLGIA